MPKSTNIINNQEITNFLNELKIDLNEKTQKYIDQVVKNYIYRDAKVSRCFPQLLKFNNSSELDLIIKKGGPFHKVVLNNALLTKLKNAVDYIESQKDQEMERILRISVEDAVKHHKQMVKRLNNLNDGVEGTIIPILKFKDKFLMVRLGDKKAFDREGKLMNHCLANYSSIANEIYSLRDPENNPLVTFQVKGKKIIQMVQKSNIKVDKKYYPYIKHFIKYNNYTISSTVSGADTAFQRIFQPASVTFVALKWKELAQVLGVDTEFLSTGMSQAISICLMLFSFIQWLDYIKGYRIMSQDAETKEINSSPEIELIQTGRDENSVLKL